MQEENSTVTALPPQRRQRSSNVLVVGVLAFLLGGAIVGYLFWSGSLRHVVPSPPLAEASAEPEAVDTTESVDVVAEEEDAQPAKQIGSVEARLALLEDRLSRIDFQADAASGNAARAEGLLIAFAARRMIDRGEPLGYVADQLRLRFMNAQPRAVETIVGFAQKPVTVDELSARLEALSPELTEKLGTESIWQRTGRQISNLFVVHRDPSALVSPSARIDRARLMLTSRRIGNAIEEVQRLPNADAAQTWIADARRYQAVQKALDLIETTAMLEPRRLQDATGQSVTQPSPLATPTAPVSDMPPAQGAAPAPAAKP